MLKHTTVVRVALACALVMAGGGCTPMLRAAESTSKWFNPNKWGGQRCGNCVESVPFNPETPDGTGTPDDPDD